MQYQLSRAEEIKAWLRPPQSRAVATGDQLTKQGRKLENSNKIDQAMEMYQKSVAAFKGALNSTRTTAHRRGKAGAQWSGAQSVLTDGAEATTAETRADIAKRILLAEKRIDQLLVVQKVRGCRVAPLPLAARAIQC